MGKRIRFAVAVFAPIALIASTAHAAGAESPPPKKVPEAIGLGGAVSSVDLDATNAGIEVLRRGGNATDAAVAVAAALGVTEPYSGGIGGGGYFVHYDAQTGEVSTLDGRETAPASADRSLFLDNGAEIPFDEAVTSGLSVGTPGLPRTFEQALDRWGTRELDTVLEPAVELAREGFRVDEHFREQTAQNEERFAAFPATRELFLPGGQPPEVGSTLRNPDLAETYETLGDNGVDAFYQDEIARDVVETVQNPPVEPESDLRVRSGDLRTEDLESYEAIEREPTHVRYRGLDVYGMAPSSSGGTTVGQALNMLENTDLSQVDSAEYLHRFLEASKVGFADRNRWVGDPEQVDVPTEGLLSQEFADSRECLIKPDATLPTPVAAGDPRAPGGECEPETSDARTPREGPHTTHLNVADATGDVVSFTITIEQTGGSGMVVPGRGFLLNNELTDFSFTPTTPGEPDPNLPGPSKRPRSSMSPTLVLDGGEPMLSVGTPGGSTIITTVLQVLTARLDRGLPLVDAIAEPRASQRNTAQTRAEPEFTARPETVRLQELGHVFDTGDGEIGNASGLERLPDGRWVAAAETTRGGGGSAAVVIPAG
ncbi:gamma-glutamyltransferase [Allosaccharopolyspora coralli]|uniref:gamma-glutamyltransferase n=1 Tax=Allosaccharopolyspora coralli TaxID=2665642 RepID=UPI003898F52F